MDENIYTFSVKNDVPDKYTFKDKNGNFYSLVLLMEKEWKDWPFADMYKEYERLSGEILRAEHILIVYNHLFPNISDELFLDKIKDFNESLKAGSEEPDVIHIDENTIIYKKRKWEKDYMNALRHTIERHNAIKILYDYISETPPYMPTEEINKNVKLESTTYISNVTYKGRNLSKVDPYFIFNLIRAQNRIMMVKYRPLEGEDIIKIYNSGSKIASDLLDRASKIEEPEKQELLLVLTYDKSSNPQFIPVRINFAYSTVLFQVPEIIGSKQSTAYITDHLKSAIKGLDIEHLEIVTLNSTFLIEFPNFDNWVLFMISRLNPIMREFIFVKETNKIMADRKSVHFYFRSFESLYEKEADSSHVLYFSVKKIESSTKYSIECKSKAGYNIIDFVKIFNRLVTIYSRIAPKYFKILEKANIETRVSQSTAAAGIPVSKIAYLKQVLPDTFPEVYGVSCQCKQQPIPVKDKEELQDWLNWNHGGPRNYFEWEGNNGQKTYLVCPSNEFTRMTTRPAFLNKLSAERRHFPCCGKADEKEEMVNEVKVMDKEETITNRMYVVEHSAYIAKGTSTVLKVGAKGNIPPEFEQFLKRAFVDGSQLTFKRQGVIQDAQNLIHCIMEAIIRKKPRPVRTKKDEVINEFRALYLNNEGNRREIAHDIRKILLDYVDPACLRQEMFDSTEEEIRRFVEGGGYMDSRITYRLMEEFFDVNVYVFVNTDMEKQASYYEVPRSKGAHIRLHKRGCDTILLFRHALKNQVLEILLASEGEGEKEIVSYSHDIGNKMLEFIYELKPQYLSIVLGKDSDIRLNPYKYVNYEDIFNVEGLEITGQIINDQGKTFVLHLNDDATIFITPTAPLNVPEINDVFFNPSEEVLSLFPEKRSEAKNGYWFDILDMPDSLFLVNEGTDGPLGDHVLYVNLVDKVERNDVTEYHRVKRLSSIYLQFVKWCFIIGVLSDYPDFDAITFFRDFVAIGKDRKTYNMRKPLFEFPEYERYINDVPGAIRALSVYWPEYFTMEGKIVMYEKLYQKMQVYFINFTRQNSGKVLTPATYLQGIFTSDRDFTHYPMNKVFMSTAFFKEWLSERRSEEAGKFTIWDIMKDFFFESIYANFYTQDDIYYIVQKVQDDTLARAIHVAHKWQKMRKNAGFFAVPKGSDITELSYVVYSIDSEKRIYPTENHILDEEDELNYLRVVQFKEDHYLALLPLN